MALSDRLTQAPRSRTGKPCSVQALMDSLGPDELKAFNAMLYELGWSQERIYSALKDEGHACGKQTINRHRSQSCGCYL